MKTFKEYIELNELPKTILSLDDEYIDSNLLDIILKEGNRIFHKKDNFYSVPISMTSSLYFAKEDNVVIGVVKANAKGIRGVKYAEIELSKRYSTEKRHKGFLIDILKIIAESTNSMILSGDEFTSDSSAVWYKYFKNPSKYGISKSYAIDIDNGEQLHTKNKIIGKDEKFKRKRFALEF